MLCPNCQQEFNSNTNVPRILVFCGHTYCQLCIESLLNQEDQNKWTLSCPECNVLNQVADGVNSFPKNLVLLQVNNPAPPLVSSSSQSSPTAADRQQQQHANSKQVCLTHNKKLEAFCEKDLQVLCIDCILSEQHKSHEIVSVQKAVEKQKQTMLEEVTNAQKTEERLKFINNDIRRHMTDMQEQADKNRRELSQIYNYIRELILEREQALKRQISDNLNKEEQECQFKLNEIGEFMSMISQIKSELLQQSQESEMEVLFRAKYRQQLSNEINGSRGKELVAYNIQTTSSNSHSLVEIKREPELIQISKIINPQFKANVLTGISGQSSLYQHTASTSNKLKRGNTVVQNQLQAVPQTQQVALDTKKEDPLLRKSTKNNQVKTKQSPHRNTNMYPAKKDSKKSSGVMVLDQNRSNKNKGGKPTGSFNHVVSQNINLYNLNQQHTLLNGKEMSCQLDDQQESAIAPEDVSSIYPLESGDLFFNYDNRNSAEQKTTGNLNDILECLNKSEMQDNNDIQRETSTASETGGSATEGTEVKDQKLKHAKSANDTPKMNLGHWGHKKDNSNGDYEIFVRNASPQRNGSQNDDPRYRSGSAQKRFSSNLLNHEAIEEDPLESKTMDNRKREESENQRRKSNQHQLQSLSKERYHRKAQKMTQSREQSPQRKKEENKSENLMMMLQECTKNIEKLEFKPQKRSPEKLKKSTSESPKKHQVATICMVDLTVREEDPEGQPQKLISERSNYDQETLHIKSENVEDILDEQKTPISTHSPIKLINTQCGDSPDRKSLMDEQMAPQRQITQQIQPDFGCSMSIDTSVSDPFKALCRMKEEFIFVFSGFNDSKLLSCEVLDIQRGVWKEVCQIGKPRTKFAAVPISKSRILLFGGKQTDGQRTGEIEEFNLKTNKFKVLPFKMPKPRSGFAACVKKEEGKIFFCGGNSGNVLRKFDCLDLKKGKWSRLPEMIHKRDELAVALGPDGKVYAIGGYGGGSSTQVNQDQSETKQGSSSNCLRTAERYDFQTGQWEMLPEMTEARRALAAVALPDGIYAIGGYDGKQYLSTVEKFDLQKQEWVPVKSMNTSRCTLSAVASSCCQYIYALGGFNGNALDLVERYNIMSDEWEFTTPMISKRFMHEAVNLVTH